MNGYNFTDRARRTLQMAREEAQRLHHEFVSTEHLLLDLLHDDQGIAVAMLTNLGVDLDDLKAAIERAVKPGASRAGGPDLPYTSRGKKVLEFAMIEARDYNHSYVGTEHLLLGLLDEEKGIAAQALTNASVTLEAARAETLRLLGDETQHHVHETMTVQGDQRFKTAIALIELHCLRSGSYPDSLDDLRYLGKGDQSALLGVKYEKLPDGYVLDLVTPPGTRPGLSYPDDFWYNLGLRS